MCNLVHRYFHWRIIAVLTWSPAILMFVDIGYLAEIWWNMGICHGFKAVAAREKYPGLLLFPHTKWLPFHKHHFQIQSVKGKFNILISILLKFVPKDPFDNKSALPFVRWNNGDQKAGFHRASLGQSQVWSHGDTCVRIPGYHYLYLCWVYY